MPGPCADLRLFVYPSIPRGEVLRLSEPCFGRHGDSHPNNSHGSDRSPCIAMAAEPCSYESFMSGRPAANTFQYTGDWVILERMTRDCTLVDDPRLADFFLVPFLFGTLSAADWQRCYPLKRMLKKALKRVISGAMLVHLNRTTASRHVFLCSTDGQFCPATFGQGDLQNATIVHLGDDNVWGNHFRNRYVLAARQKGQGVVWHNALTVPHRVSQWLPPFARPNPLAPRPLLLSGNVNLNRSSCRGLVAGHLQRLAFSSNVSDRVVLAGRMLAPGDAGQLAASSIFCLVPTGDNKGFTARFYFVLLSGCIPVRIDCWDRRLGFHETAFPFPSLINWSKLVVSASMREGKRAARESQRLFARLLSMRPSELLARRQYLAEVAHWLTYDQRDARHDATAALLHELTQRDRRTARGPHRPARYS